VKLRKSFRRTACLAAALATAGAEDGKWTPQQLLQLDAKWLQKQGLEIPVSRLWNPENSNGLLAATISTGSCSGGFVSSNGLFISNHHCLFGILQENSAPGRDLITNGFVAATPEQELPSKSMRITAPHKFTDVTPEMEAAVAASAPAMEAKQRELVAACEKTPGMRCSVAAFDGGLQYVLVESIELTDIRLVYAPPRGVGEFGGETDNFHWPRHTGDVALARAYKDGKPYRSEFYFPVSRAGVMAGDFVMVLGYPFRTVRSMTGEEMAYERDFRFQFRGQIYAEWIRRIEETTAGNPQGQIALAAVRKNLNNLATNGQGMLAGLARGAIIEKQKAHDDAVVAWAAKRPEFAASLAAKRELDRLAVERRCTGARDALFVFTKNGPIALRQAITLVRLAKERGKPDAERDPEYAARQLPALRGLLERDQKNFFHAADVAMMQVWLDRAGRLDAAERIAAVDASPTARALYSATRVTNLDERLKMFEENTEQLRARQDPLLQLAFALDPELRAWQSATQSYDGAAARLRPLWRRAVIAYAGGPVPPDANNTVRVNLAHVKGFAPSDGVEYLPQTTLAGMIEKHTGKEPFTLPPDLLEAARRGHPEQIPLNFLADADTTGGSSGSPVINGRGELVGVNFDRPWENVAGDFGYDANVARNISVDVRFLLWMLEQAPHAGGILKELVG
jgi:hypothetical protein